MPERFIGHSLRCPGFLLADILDDCRVGQRLIREKVFQVREKPAQKRQVFLPVVRKYVVRLWKQPDFITVYLVQHILIQIAERLVICQFQRFTVSAGCAYFLQVHQHDPCVDIVPCPDAPFIFQTTEMRFFQAEPISNSGDAHPVHIRIIQIRQGPGNHQVAVQIQTARFPIKELRQKKAEVGHLNRVRTQAARLIRYKAA